MKHPKLIIGSMSLALMAFSLPSAAEARHHHYYYHMTRGHGRCLRFDKTTGTVAGAVGGGVLGSIIGHGTGATLVGAAAGGLLGHELARDGRKRC